MYSTMKGGHVGKKATIHTHHNKETLSRGEISFGQVLWIWISQIIHCVRTQKIAPIALELHFEDTSKVQMWLHNEHIYVPTNVHSWKRNRKYSLNVSYILRSQLLRNNSAEYVPTHVGFTSHCVHKQFRVTILTHPVITVSNWESAASLHSLNKVVSKWNESLVQRQRWSFKKNIRCEFFSACTFVVCRNVNYSHIVWSANK